jgi:hypothetical protein
MSPLLVAVSLFVTAPPVAEASAVFEKLKSFEGNWKAGDKEAARYVSIRVISNATAVLETVTGADRTKVLSAALYYLDGAKLVLAHYGPGGAPRLEARAGGNVEFEAKGAAVSFVSLKLSGDKLVHETVSATGKSVVELRREYIDTLK